MTLQPLSELDNTSLTPGTSHTPQIPRWFLQLLVGVVAVIFVVVIVFFVRYLVNPRPIEELISPELGLDSPPHYLGSIYDVNHPVGVAVSPDGDRIYVSESGGERLVQVFDRRGQELGALVPATMRAVERSPVYMAVSSDGYLLVTDRSRHLISIYAPDGILEAEYEPGWSPLGVRLCPDGTLLVTDVSSGHNSVRQLAINSDASRFQTPTLSEIGPILGENRADSGKLNFPNSAVRDARGRIYVSDGNNWRIAVWDSNGDFLYHFGAGAGMESVSLPRGLYIDHRQRLYVVDVSAHKVKVYGLEGEMPEFLFAFGDLGTGDQNFQYPTDIAVDQNGRIYIADRENNRVQIWTY